MLLSTTGRVMAAASGLCFAGLAAVIILGTVLIWPAAAAGGPLVIAIVLIIASVSAGLTLAGAVRMMMRAFTGWY